MQSNLKDTIDKFLKKVPGIIGLILIDLDGMPIYVNGRFDISISKLSATAATCFACAVQIGKKIDQSLTTILAEYESIKIYQLGLNIGAQLIIFTKTKESQFGMLKIEANKTMAEISQSIHSLRKVSENKS